jgi:uncharacterized membrane protein YcaP (DUF421 family)
METIWSHLFVLTLPVLEKILRPILVYAFLVVGLRLAGKRELGSLNPFDLVVLLTISNTVQNAIIGNDNSLLGGVIGASTLLVVNHLVVRFVHRNKKIEDLVEGKEARLITRGHVQFRTLEEENIDITELEIAAHKQGYQGINEIDEAILETDGGISFIAREQSPTEKRQNDVIARIMELESKIDQMTAKLSS